MARTFKVLDDDTGVEATLVMGVNDQQQPVVRSITLIGTDDRGVRAADLLVLEAFGLKLPDAALEAREREHVSQAIPAQAAQPSWMAKAAKPATAKPTAKKAPAKKAATPVKANGSKRPTDALLIADYQRYRGKATALAEHYGVSSPTAYAWLADLRKRGLLKPVEQPQTLLDEAAAAPNNGG